MLATMCVAMMARVSGASNPGDVERITVYVLAEPGIPLTIISPGEEVARRTFARIGVSVEWRHLTSKEPPSPSSMIVRVTNDPSDYNQGGTLAYARPYEGSAITISYSDPAGVIALQNQYNATLAALNAAVSDWYRSFLAFQAQNSSGA